MTPKREAEIWRMAQELGGTFICTRLDSLADAKSIRRREARELSAKIRGLLDGARCLERWIAENFDAPEILAYCEGDTHQLDGATKDWISKERRDARRRWLDHLIADAEQRAAATPAS